ncbi:flagellar motor switch protein FliN [Nocardioides sp. Bht2]|uniref:flagellar motor switch protein FliN n=1 Tax=Nocardioides sp. Bht2 TaxID=3392297 RepID=UPI0039B61460
MNPTDLATAAATAVAGILPAAAPLTVAPPQPGTEHVASAFAGAVIAEVSGSRTGAIALLVGADLVNALAASPLGGLDLAAATQPALDAAAASLGLSAGRAMQAEPALVVADLGGNFLTVPLIGTGIDAAVLLPDALLAESAPLPSAPFVADPTAAQSNAATGLPSAPAAAAPTAFGGAVAGAPAPGAVATATAPARGIEMLHGVDMEVTVELGRTRMTVRDLLALSPGAVLELDRAAGSPADLLVNGRLIARGEVVVVDEDFGLRITEVLAEATAG